MFNKIGREGKIAFVISINHAVDIITNSSSELFILKSKTPELMIELLDATYSDWRSEYREPIKVSEAEVNDLSTWIDRLLYSWDGDRASCERITIPSVTFEEQWEEDAGYLKQGKIKFVPKEGFIENNMEKIVNHFDPNKEKWLLYSLDENPNWDRQEDLMSIGERYHLG